jgi:hypothetical protein
MLIYGIDFFSFVSIAIIYWLMSILQGKVNILDDSSNQDGVKGYYVLHFWLYRLYLSNNVHWNKLTTSMQDREHPPPPFITCLVPWQSVKIFSLFYIPEEGKIMFWCLEVYFHHVNLNALLLFRLLTSFIWPRSMNSFKHIFLKLFSKS